MSIKAQDVTDRDTTRFIGFQSNQLIKQLINFGGPSNNLSGYIFDYVRAVDGGMGLHLGFGVNLSKSDLVSQFTNVNNSNTDLLFRVGGIWQHQISKKAIAGIGYDIALEYLRRKSISETDFNFGSPTEVTSLTNEIRLGVGPRFSLTYQLSPRIYLGTESTLYPFVTYADENVETKVNDQVQEDNSFDDSKLGYEMTFTSPTVLFLYVTF